MSDAVKVQLELVYLRHDVVVARNLGIGIVDELTTLVIDAQSYYLRLFHQVLEPLLNMLHDSVKMSAQRGQRRAVNHE